MNRKGFTLVELLGVVVLLGVLGLAIIPKIGDSINNSKQSAYNTQVESIKKGITDFLIDNSDILLDNSVFSFNLGTIIRGGYLPLNITNPITRKKFSHDSTVVVSINDGKYDIDLDLFDYVGVIDSVDDNDPIIILNGNFIEFVPVFSDYIDKGAIAKDSNDNVLVMDVPKIMFGSDYVSKLDTSRLGTYSVVYSLEGSNVSAVRTVIVSDIYSPVIYSPGDITLNINEVSSFDIMKDVYAIDDYDGKVSVSYSTDLVAVPGNYVIDYSASDFSGNVGSLRRVVNVVE